MSPRIGPYSPLAAILAKPVADTSRSGCLPRFRPTLLAVSDAGSVVSPTHDGVSA